MPEPDAWRRGEKKTAKELVRRIISETPDGPVSGPYGVFLAALLARHPDAAEKIGSGIARITLGPVPGRSSRGFVIHRTDGTSTDFSWLECISETSHRTRVLTAMRDAVEEQIRSFKRAQEDAGLRCAVTGRPLEWQDADADHHPVSFLTLADAYAAAAGGYEKIALVPSADGLIGRPLDPGHEAVWKLWHQQEARLRILSKAAHRQATRQQRQQPS